MHTSLHSLAHRAPPATRTKVRWQPYVSLAPCTGPRTPPSTYLSTPSSSISLSPPLSTPSSSFDHERFRSTASIAIPSQKESKTKYALSLVDQAVNALNDLWHPQDIPPIFLTANTNGTELVAFPTTSQILRLCNRNTQLPSPISPNTLPSPPAVSPPAVLPSGTLPSSAIPAIGTQTALVPLRGFIHEVLRRSRTSGSILQTALCYLEAVRPRIKSLIEAEKSGNSPQEHLEANPRIEIATEAEIQQDLALEASLTPELTVDSQFCSEVMDTVRICDVERIDYDESLRDANTIPKTPQIPSPLADAPPPLPSPLLCPRRAFLAALILASKFANDKCYSNRAWAKLSGLPPREIGRCERALGEALDWRLWVGKSSSMAMPATGTPSAQDSTAISHRGLTRCRSESNLQKPEPFFASQDDLRPSNAKSGIRRCRTVPSSAFTSNPSPPSTVTMPYVNQSMYTDSNHWDYLDGPPTEKIDANPATSFGSPCLDTPSLSFSPSSTESSADDHTVLVSFIDDPMGLSSGYNTVDLITGSAPSLDSCKAMHIAPDFVGPFVQCDMQPVPGYFLDPADSKGYAVLNTFPRPWTTDLRNLAMS